MATVKEKKLEKELNRRSKQVLEYKTDLEITRQGAAEKIMNNAFDLAKEIGGIQVVANVIKRWTSMSRKN
jgi:hypothetical protein